VSGATTVLLNDLDITLTDQDSNTFYPLVVSNSNTESEHDRLNPVEIIRLSSPRRNATYTLTVSAHSLVTTQPYALIISGNIGQYPYTPPKRDYTMYILAGILLMSLITCCVLGCVYFMTKRNANKDQTKVGARLEDDEDDETETEEYSNKMKSREKSSQHENNQKRSPVALKSTKKKIYPEGG
jgi:hypothetical protein